MYENEFCEYWAQPQFCYFKVEAAKGPASRHLCIQMAQDWITPAETLMPEIEQQIGYRPGG